MTTATKVGDTSQQKKGRNEIKLKKDHHINIRRKAVGVQDGGGKYSLYWNTKLLRSYRKIATNGSFYYKGNADRPTYTTTCKGRGEKKMATSLLW